MKKVLLTGSNGLLGQKITNLLVQSGKFQLLATSSGANRNTSTASYEYASLDITDSQSVINLLNVFKPDFIINSAAMTNVDACELDPVRCQKINVDAVQTLVSFCQKESCHLVHVSTDFIFDGQNGPYREVDLPAPISVYGQSKFDAENVILSSGIPSSIARTIILYGTVPGLSRTNIVLWVKESLEKGTSIKVVCDQYRAPTLAEDLATGIVEIISREKSGIYHLSGPEIMSVYEMACRIADFWKLDSALITPIDSATLSQPARRPPKTGFIILKAIQDLDYKPNTLESGLTILDKQLRMLVNA